MAGYIIVDVKVHDPETYEEYKKLVMPTLEAYGGKFVVRGGRTETLEGAWVPERLVILEFESVERAKEWWGSQEYDGPKRMRQSASQASLIVAEGA
jgi:uncharacterized protein (DUF1330 family)